MFRFTIRELCGFTVVAAVSCVLTIVFAPADTVAQLMMAGLLFVFGGACYTGGIVLGRWSRVPNGVNGKSNYDS